MSRPTSETVLERLDRLERQNRRIKLLTILLLIGITALVGMGQATPPNVAKVIEAEKFIIRDTSGNTRGGLGMLGNDVALVLYGKGQKVRAALRTLDGDRGSLYLYNKNQENNIQLYIKSDGAPGMVLGKEDGPKIAMLLTTEGEPGIGFIDQNGKLRSRQTLQANNGSPHLELYDTEQKNRFTLDLQSNGDPRVVLIDKYGKKRIVQGLLRGAPKIFLTDEAEKPIWGAP